MMVLALALYSFAAAIFYVWLARTAIVVDEEMEAATHPARTTEVFELFPAEARDKAA